jgi:hypothetical protein
MLSDLPGVASGYVADEGVACYGAWRYQLPS